MMKSMKVLKFLAAIVGLVLCATEMPNGELNIITAIAGFGLFLPAVWDAATSEDDE